MNTPREEGMRAEFEEWYSDGGKYPRAVERNSAGQYLLAQAAMAWQCWQAATQRERGRCEQQFRYWLGNGDCRYEIACLAAIREGAKPPFDAISKSQSNGRS